jgi:hypothetical protein
LIGHLDESWQRKERLRYIDAKLFWSGEINRLDICDQFELHETNASKDLKAYIELAPTNIVYDRSAKLYRATPLFKPIGKVQSVDKLLAYTALDIPYHGYENTVFDAVPYPVRAPNPTITRNILVTIKEDAAIKILYRSMKNPTGKSRWVVPKVIIFDGLRWHLRAFDEGNHGYRDFVLSRIKRADEQKYYDDTLPSDTHWESSIDVKIGPHPKLSSAQAKMISDDFNMRSGKLKIKIRKAMVQYLVRLLNLDTDLEPPRQQLACYNLDELDGLY